MNRLFFYLTLIFLFSSCGIFFVGKDYSPNLLNRFGGVKLDVNVSNYDVYIDDKPYPNPEDFNNPTIFQLIQSSLVQNNILYLKKNQKQTDITIKKSGYSPITFTLEREFNPNTLWNIGNAGIFFLTLDLPYKGYLRFREHSIKVNLISDGINKTIAITKSSKDSIDTTAVITKKTSTPISQSLTQQKPELSLQTGHSSGVLEMELTPDNKYLISIGKDNKIIVWDIHSGKQYNYLDAKEIGVSNMDYSAVTNQIVCSGKDSTVYIYDVPNLNLVDTLQFNEEIYDLSFGFYNDGIEYLLVGCKELYKTNLQSRERISLLTLSEKFIKKSNRKEKPIYISFDPLLSQFGLSYKSKMGAMESSLKNKYLTSANNTSATYYADAGGIIHAYEKTFKVNTYHGHGDNNVTGLAVDSSNQVLASGDEIGSINLWDIPSGLLVKELKSGYQKINDLRFSPDGTKMIFCNENGKFKFWNLATNDIISSSINPTKESRNKGWKYNVYEIASISASYCVFKVEKYNTNKLSKSVYFNLTWSFGSDEIVLKLDKSEPNVENLDKSNVVENPKQPFYAEIMDDGMIMLKDNVTNDELVRIVAINNNDFLYFTTEGYYYASKGALDYVGFKLNDKIYSFEQFDLIYNRPDLVFSKLPFYSGQVIQNYEDAYQKRLSKLNIKDVNEIDFTNVPSINIKREKIISTQNKSYDFEVTAIDSNISLKSLQVIVNGVPIYSNDGKPISGAEIKENISLNLSEDINNVQVYATNVNGVSSLTSTFKIVCNYKFDKPNLYVIAIGSGKFEQNQYNLNYADKDANDVYKTFMNLKGYEKNLGLLLTGEQVNLDALEKIKAHLGNTKENDKVFVFVAGHGVLDENLDYYLSTYDIDFINPSSRGIAYIQLEELLNNCKARKKTLFLDACHSGEIDKEELAQSQSETEYDSDIVFRSIGNSESTGAGIQSTFDLSKMMFADIRTGGGVSIISAAGGGEFAMESAKWSNGVFTYCLLKGLNEGDADLDKDGEILLTEVQTYLFSQVNILTNGKQQPTSRRENLFNNFKIK